MSFTNNAAREINLKIVYCGPGLAGKSTNMKYIFDKTAADAKGKWMTLPTGFDQILFFDFLPTGLMPVRGFNVRVHPYTVPGEVYANTSRVEVLKNADGIVFVADSSPDKREANRQSFDEMIQNLQERGFTLDRIPNVIQYNKRDVAGAISVDDLRADLNVNRVPDFEAVASSGQGVFETFKAIVKLAVKKI